MRFRGLSVIWLMLGVALLLFSCTKEQPGGDAMPEKRNEEPETVKLTVWIWEAAGEGLKLNMEAFRSEYPHIDVEIQYMLNEDLYQKLMIAANMGDKVPDVVALETSHAARMVQIGALLDITEQASPYVDKMNAFKWADVTRDGKIYALPWDTGPVVMFYRRDLFAQAGLPVEPAKVAERVKTFEDYKEIGEAIRRKTDAWLMSESLTRSNNRFFENMMWQRGLWYFDAEGRVILDSPEVVAIGEYVVDLVRQGYVFDAEPWMEDWIDALAEGKIATIVGASWFEVNLPRWLDPEGEGKWAVAPMPVWSPDDPYASANDGGSNLAINVNSEHPEEAWTFIEFMLGRESSQLRMMDEGGFFPSLETTYDHPVYSERLEYFGGQPIRRLFVDAVRQIHPQPYTADYPLANQLMTDAFAKIFLGGGSVEQVFRETAGELRARTGRK